MGGGGSAHEGGSHSRSVKDIEELHITKAHAPAKASTPSKPSTSISMPDSVDVPATVPTSLSSQDGVMHDEVHVFRASRAYRFQEMLSSSSKKMRKESQHGGA